MITPILFRRPIPVIARSRRFWNMVRFGRPVSPSDSACSSFSAAWRRRRCDAPATTPTSVPHSRNSPSPSITYIECVSRLICAAIPL